MEDNIIVAVTLSVLVGNLIGQLFFFRIVMRHIKKKLDGR